MGKKRENLADGVKTAYQVYQALDVIRDISRSKIGAVRESLREGAMILACMAIVCGVFWLLSVVITFFKKSLL